MKTTLKAIKKFDPCQSGWNKLIHTLGTDNPSTEVTISQILDSNGIQDAVWALCTQKYEDYKDFLYSTTASRLNGYTGGYGDPDTLERELDSYGLSDKGERILLEIAERGLRQACPVPVK